MNRYARHEVQWRGLAFVAALAVAFALLPATGGEARKKTCKVRGSHTRFKSSS